MEALLICELDGLDLLLLCLRSFLRSQSRVRLSNRKLLWFCNLRIT